MSVPSEQAKAVFLEATEGHAPEAWPAFLDRACAGDPGLRGAVERLLRARAELGSFHEAAGPALGPTVDAGAGELPGAQIGPYKLIEPIGEGGMGTVYLAQQTEPVKRLVALKVIKAGMDSRQVLARFEAERQALALMDHPNIARVLDAAATPAGRPYFVMELVKGVPITKYCDEHRLLPKDRLELFVQVCQAVQHAHQKGIIHRDLKPSNVLVAPYDGRPVVKVIDFGVAKAAGVPLTDKTLVTGLGAVVGTLEYMSPEQAELNNQDVDTRSDIYCLGILLYELLTGTTPLTRGRLKDAAFVEMLRLIREEEPPKPSTRLSDSTDSLPSISAQRHMEPAKLTRLVRGELDWIVMKALEKDRARRYETANGFAADVQRYLADEAVLACPPSAGYRFRKFARRNKVAIGVAGMVLFFLVLLGSGAGWALRDREAREQEIALETARKLAMTEQGIRQALDRGTTSRAELHDILKKPGGAQQLLNQPARWELLIKTAQGELTQARQFAVRAEGSLGTEWTLAMDELERQLTSDQADYDLARRLEKFRLDRATSVDGRFDNRKAADEYPKAFAVFAVLSDDPAIVPRLASSPIKEQLVAALDDWALIASYLRKEGLAEQLLAVARQTAPDPAWGDRLRQVGVWGDAEALGKLAAQAPASGLSPQLLDYVGALLAKSDSPLKESWLRQAQAEHPIDFWLNFNLAGVLAKTSPVEAAGFYRVALAVRPGNSAVYTNLGSIFHDQWKLSEAIAVYHKAIEIDPKNTAAHNNLGRALFDQGKLDEAIACHRKAIELDPTKAISHNNLSLALYRQKKLDEAVASCRKAIDLDPKYHFAHSNLGLAFMDQGKLDEAVACHRKAIDLAPKHAIAHYNLGLALYRQKKLDEAVASYRKAIEIDPKYAPAHHNLGHVLYEQKKLDEAIACHRKALELDPKDALAHNSLGNALHDQGKRDEAMACFRKAIELDPKFAHAHNGLGNALHDQGRLDEAIACYQKAIALDPQLHMAHNNLGTALHDQGKVDEAIACYQKAIELNPKYALAHLNLGRALISQKKLDEAIAAYRKAIELKPDYAEAWQRRHQVYMSLKQYDRAFAEYSRAIELKPDYAEAWQYRHPLYGPKQYEKAVADYSKAIELKPDNALAWRYRGSAHATLEQYDRAVADYSKAIELKPDDSTALSFRSTAYQRLKQWDKAIADQTRVVELSPTSFHMHILARMLAMCPDPKFRDAARAVELAKRCVELNPPISRFWNPWNTLGVAHYRAGDWKAALAALHKAMERDKAMELTKYSREGAYQFFLAMAYWRLDNKDEARKWYDRAVAWMAKNELKHEELLRFRAEAEELMGVTVEVAPPPRQKK